MNRTPYKIKNEEIATLLDALDKHGYERTYQLMEHKALSTMESRNNIDEMFLDMADSLQRIVCNNIDLDQETIEAYDIIASMLRRIAHRVYRRYINGGKWRDNSRFLRLVSINGENICPTK